jgi:hypothetical protein
MDFEDNHGHSTRKKILKEGDMRKVLQKPTLASCLFVVLSALLFSAVILGQTTLNNDAVVKMVKAGLAEDVIVSMIGSQATQFAVGADDLISLKTQGVPDKIIGAMLSKSSGGAAAPAASNGAAANAAPAGTPNEIGVYFKKKGEWVEVIPEIVNWKTGGVLKNKLSGGLVKGDVNGNLKGESSKNSVATPLEFLVITPEGVNVSEYQLIRLHTNKGEREFRTVTGGVFHAEGGANRDMVDFEGKKTAAKTFSVVLPDKIGAGEYGFLPPGAFASANSSSIGKMYTFHIVE